MGLLNDAGYTSVDHYIGGLAEWLKLDRPFETSLRSAQQADVVRRMPKLRAPALLGRLINRLEAATPRMVARRSILLVVGCALLYLGLCHWPGHGITEHGQPIPIGWRGLWTSLYFSVVTATTLGYGEVAPEGFSRVVAIAEALSGLLLFGAVLAKFLSRKQERLVEEIARMTFEDRLGRMQSGLHTVIGDLIDLGDACRGSDADPERLGPRLESTVLVFGSQLRGLYDLLYRPQKDPDEDVLEALLAALVAALNELCSMLKCDAIRELPRTGFDRQLSQLSALANGICGECVPRHYARHLEVRMDRVRELAGDLAPSPSA